MTKRYRIQMNKNGSYRVQERSLFIFWFNVWTSVLSLDEANKILNAVKKGEELRKNERTWRTLSFH